MKKSNIFIIGLLIAVILIIAHEATIPQKVAETTNLKSFSRVKALEHIQQISKEQHHVGAPAHAKVKNYLENELKNLGLEVVAQDTMVLSKWQNLVKVQNVVARKKGKSNGKALLLMTHYDSAPQSRSFGASDNGNGLGTILEGMRMFIENNQEFKNDIIILFSDAEELGLNGAYGFNKHHPWNEDVGVVVNFEARGTSGPSMMLAETNHGNQALIEAFSKAKVPYPVANSLMYSVYKMLPNDTDLTAFREVSDIPGYNFAYIDGHYHYHTELDNYDNLDPKSVEHQATYFIGMVNHLANADLSQMNAQDDMTYFNIPQKFIYYPSSWNFYLWMLALILFIGISFFAIVRKELNLVSALKGFLPLLLSLISAGGLTFILWKLILKLYPSYADMLCGFTYNGHDYMFAFAFLSIYLFINFYHKFYKKETFHALSFASLFIWLILTFFIQQKLNGASFLIIPLIFSILSWGLALLTKLKSPYIHFLLAIPSLLIIVPLVYLFPIGLGLNIMFGSSILVVLILSLLLPLFYESKGLKPFRNLFMLLFLSFILKAHLNSGFNEKNPKPNSLVYVSDYTKNQHYWATYNNVLDNWVSNYIDEKNQLKGDDKLQESKYNSGFTFKTPTENKDIAKPEIITLKDSVYNNLRHFTFEIKANRFINKMELYVPNATEIYHFEANGIKNDLHTGDLLKRKNNSDRILGFYPIDTLPLTVSFAIKNSEKLHLDVVTTSFDLLEHPKFSVPKRPKNQTPMGFVLTEAIMVKERVDK